VKSNGDIQERLLQTGVQPLTTQWCAESQDDWGKLYQSANVTSCVSINGRYTAFYDNIAAVLLEGESLMVDPEQAFEVIELLEIAQRSAAQGCVIKL
jgi:hypothetical protein